MTNPAFGHRRPGGSRFSNYRWIPWVFVGAFLVIFGANAGLIYFATESWPGLTTDHAYNEGLAYNRVIDEAEKEAKLGWKVDIAFDPKVNRDMIAVTIRDKSGTVIDGLVVNGELVRPVEELPQQPLRFHAQGGGRYVARIGAVRAGQWNVYLSAHRGDEVWRGGHKILVPMS
jgi:nitrogen fixation protein FixH